MINILINGIGGKMGTIIFNMAKADSELNIIGGVDLFANPSDYTIPIFSKISDCKEKVDVVIDFSRPDALNDILTFCKKNKACAVLCTTGYQKNDYDKIDEASKSIAIFQSANMSLGINLLSNLLKNAVKFLKDYDIEIIEKHHNQKVDSPSGTAILLADSINSELSPKRDYVYGRYGNSSARKQNDLTIHAIRGGTIVGEHEVIFAYNDEVITFSHEAHSKAVFATGAINAAKYIVSKINGKYDMNDLINDK